LAAASSNHCCCLQIKKIIFFLYFPKRNPVRNWNWNRLAKWMKWPMLGMAWKSRHLCPNWTIAGVGANELMKGQLIVY
jgi:hypothetical protein